MVVRVKFEGEWNSIVVLRFGAVVLTEKFVFNVAYSIPITNKLSKAI